MTSSDCKLPQRGKRNILVTSALPYVNNVPHLGNLIGCVLSADTFARYCRLRGYNVIYMCGTDEYGTATETKAMEENLTPREICDKYHAIHKEIYEWFDIQFDKFGRTSTPQQTEICQQIFLRLLENGLLLEDKMEQLYCDNCKKFLADRFVLGICPHCAKNARGDQCESCSRLLNPTELNEPKCKICGNSPHVRETEHLFLDLPKLKDQLEEYVERTSRSGGWSANSVQTTNAWIRDGLKPRCITRDLKWGVPVPLEKFQDKVFYVWFDAPIGYISITSTYTPDWKEWWQPSEDVELFQFMGKDNVPFHTVIFPCTLLGTADPWNLMRTISVTEYLNYESGKFSKTQGIGVFGTDAKDTKIPVEVWRYYLLTNRPEVSDTQFLWADLQAKQNNELLKNLGNFVHRTLSFLAKPSGEGYGGIIPEVIGAEKHVLTMDLCSVVHDNLLQYIDAMEKVSIKKALKVAMNISSLGNQYLQDSAFWKLYKEDQASCAIVIKTATALVLLLAILLEPFMPAFSRKVLEQLNLPLSALSLCTEGGDLIKADKLYDFVPSGHRIGVPVPLFFELKDSDVEEYRERFAGSQTDRADRAAAASAAAGLSKKIKQTNISDVNGEKSAKGSAPAVKRKMDGKDAKDGPVDISRLDIRVGKIIKAQKHPAADSLYVEEIDVGEGAPRTVVSGLVKYISLEDLQNRKVCVLCNLKPATMRGVKSQAMVLAASDSEHTTVELVIPPESAQVGERIRFTGFEGEPDEVLNPKKKIWESVQVDLRTNDKLVACYKNVPFTTSTGVCTVASIANGSIR
ncbi:hypothetical protein KP509_08G035400 [Ceratopteris richardii]|uniref:methionine--tRNA ligase n=1 Tax=Ceratopteris richardii TaxID=49495 RepID=A0A8T2UFG6_CERRI|nr:hypothetical protein KP509_08G035400 [Ceratopteris richardii]